jgi:hypothetical protein
MPEDEVNESANRVPALDDPALIEDLNRYDNPEVFGDPAVPQYYRFQIPPFPERPILVVGVDGNELPNVLRERFFHLASPDPNQELTEGWDSWEEARADLLSNKAFLEFEQRMLLLFVRHLPQLTMSFYRMLETMTILGALADRHQDQSKKNEVLNPNLKLFLRVLEQDMKQMLGMRRRGGSRGRVAAKTRQSFHTWYDDVHKSAKVIKKYYDKVFEEFDNNHRRKGYTHKQWQEFWAQQAQERYGSEREFALLFAEPGGLSASEVAYTWMAQKTNYTPKYIQRLVMNSRALARKRRESKR